MGWLIATGIGLLLAWLAERRRRVYADLETIPAAAVYAGRNEVKGRAWHARPTHAHETHLPCVWWRYTLEEERKEKSTDATRARPNFVSATRLFSNSPMPPHMTCRSLSGRLPATVNCSKNNTPPVLTTAAEGSFAMPSMEPTASSG